MQEEDFLVYLKKAKKSETTSRGYLNSVRLYEEYLQSYKDHTNPANATQQDIRGFIHWGLEKGENVYRHLWGIRAYYWFLQLDEMANTACEQMEFIQNETRRLSEFPKVDPQAITQLASVGIKTVNQFLEAAQTKEGQEKLIKDSGIRRENLVELLQLSNLSRLPGAKKVRGRLFYEAGLNTFSKIADLTPEEIQQRLSMYIEESGFEGSSPTLSEAEYTVTMAKFLLKLDS